MPAWIIALIVSRPSHAGPIVAISLVLRISRARIGHPQGGSPLYRRPCAAAIGRKHACPKGLPSFRGVGAWTILQGMWLNALAALVLAACVAAGAWRGALATGLGIATLVLSYAAAMLF